MRTETPKIRTMTASFSFSHGARWYDVRVMAVGDGWIVSVAAGGNDGPFRPLVACCGWRAGRIVRMPPPLATRWPKGLAKALRLKLTEVLNAN